MASESADANPSISMSDVRTIIRFCDSPDAQSSRRRAESFSSLLSVQSMYMRDVSLALRIVGSF